MWFTILTMVGGYAKKILTNPIVIVALLMVGTLFIGRYWGRSGYENAVQKEVIKEIKVYVKAREAIETKYNGNKFEDQMILSGCVAEVTKLQKHCKETK